MSSTSAMIDLVVDDTEHLEADDGVVDVTLVAEHLTFPWAALPAGPRRWAPTDLSVEVCAGSLRLVRLSYRTVGDRVVIVAGASLAVDAEWLAEQLATPLLFAHLRRVNGSVAPTAVLVAMAADPIWDEAAAPGGWRFGRAGVGDRPVRLAHQEQADGHVVVAAHGVVIEEVEVLVAGLVAVTPGSPSVDELHQRHRRALAQRWWDAPRAPWTPDS